MAILTDLKGRALYEVKGPKLNIIVCAQRARIEDWFTRPKKMTKRKEEKKKILASHHHRRLPGHFAPLNNNLLVSCNDIFSLLLI